MIFKRQAPRKAASSPNEMTLSLHSTYCIPYPPPLSFARTPPITSVGVGPVGKPSLPAARGLQQSSQAGRNARFLPGPQGHGWYSSGCTVHGDTIVLWARVTSPLPPSSFSIPHVLCRLICVIPASVIRRRTHYCGDITRWKNVLKCLSCHVSHGLHSACRRVSSSRVVKEGANYV